MNKLIPLAVIGAVSYIGRSGRAAGHAADARLGYYNGAMRFYRGRSVGPIARGEPKIADAPVYRRIPGRGWYVWEDTNPRPTRPGYKPDEEWVLHGPFKSKAQAEAKSKAVTRAWYDRVSTKSGRAAGRAAEHPPTYDLPQLAFYDSMRGLIPVKALSRDPNRPGLIRMKVTAARPGYPRGYEFRARDFQVVPRDRVRRRKFSTRILPYTWVR